jgi:hypothetical protein
MPVTTITVEAKIVGQKRPLFTDYHLPIPPEFTGSGRITLRDLVTAVVVKEVEAFTQRQEERRLARVLSPQDIERGAERGKIDSGERDAEQKVDENAAAGAALQAFEDGLYFVFLDGAQQESLDQTVFVSEDSRMLFVRLVALAGG